MAKKVTLKDGHTGEVEYPLTLTEQVIDKNGKTVDAAINEKFDDINDKNDKRFANMQTQINEKQAAIGAVQTDELPKEGSDNLVTSAGIYEAFHNKQFVDDEPKAGSGNLVTSGGVKKEIDKINNNTYIQTEGLEQESIKENTFLDNKGTFISNNLYCCRIYDVSDEEVLYIEGTVQGTNNVACYAFYSGTPSPETLVSAVTITDFIGHFEGAQMAEVATVIRIPDNVKKIVTCSVTSFESQMLVYKVESIKKGINDLQEKEREINKRLDNLRLFDIASPDDVRTETFITQKGEFMSNSLYRTDIYNIKEGAEIKIKGSITGSNVAVCYALYRGEPTKENFISYFGIIEANGQDFQGSLTVKIDKTLEVPSGVTTMAVNYVPSLENTVVYKREKDITEAVECLLGHSVKYVDCLGDSLTMGAIRFGWYEDTLQDLLGEQYVVRNWGVGGEASSTIMARQGSASTYFPAQFKLLKNGEKTLVADSDTQSLLIKTVGYDENVVPLLQGSENDNEQQTRVVNPCYINGIECSMSYIQGSAYGKGSWYIKRNKVGNRDIDIPANTPIYFNTGKEMGNSDISIIWMGANDGIYDDWKKLVDKHKAAVNKLSNQKYIIIGLHNLRKSQVENYEKLMSMEFGNKFFNLREYMCTNMIYDAGVTPTAEDLSNMSNGYRPQSLIYDTVHLKPEANVALGKMLYELCKQLGYLQ